MMNRAFFLVGAGSIFAEEAMRSWAGLEQFPSNLGLSQLEAHPCASADFCWNPRRTKDKLAKSGP